MISLGRINGSLIKGPLKVSGKKCLLGDLTTVIETKENAV